MSRFFQDLSRLLHRRKEDELREELQFHLDEEADERRAKRDFVMRGMSGSDWEEPKLGKTTGVFPFPAFEILQKNSGAAFANVLRRLPGRDLHPLERRVFVQDAPWI